MLKPIRITTPIPSPEELADELGVSRKRVKELRSMLRKQGLLTPKSKRPGTTAPRFTSVRTPAAKAQFQNALED